MLIQKIRTIHRQLPATTGGGADQVVRRISTPSASSALILSTTRSGVDIVNLTNKNIYIIIVELTDNFLRAQFGYLSGVLGSLVVVPSSPHHRICSSPISSHSVQVLIQIPFHSRSKKEEKKNPRSAWLRYHLLTMRLYQNFKKSTKVDLQKKCKRKN